MTDFDDLTPEQQRLTVLSEPEESVPAPGDPQRWTLRTVGLEESP